MPRFLLHFTMKNGEQYLPLSPYARSLFAESHEVFDYAVPVDAANWQALAIDRLGLVTGLVLNTDAPIKVRVYSQMDGEISLDAGGKLIIWDTNLRTQTRPTVELLNAGADPVRVHGIAVGVGLQEP